MDRSLARPGVLWLGEYATGIRVADERRTWLR